MNTLPPLRPGLRPLARIAAAAFPALAILALSACVVAPPPQYGVATYPAYTVATVPPPAPMGEVVGVAPYPGYFWISGYWGWIGGRYTWNAGHWQAPRPGYRWVPHRWVPQGNVWRGEGGRWERH